jgi:hypothetical protein
MYPFLNFWTNYHTSNPMSCILHLRNVSYKSPCLLTPGDELLRTYALNLQNTFHITTYNSSLWRILSNKEIDTVVKKNPPLQRQQGYIDCVGLDMYREWNKIEFPKQYYI